MSGTAYIVCRLTEAEHRTRHWSEDHLVQYWCGPNSYGMAGWSPTRRFAQQLPPVAASAALLRLEYPSYRLWLETP